LGIGDDAVALAMAAGALQALEAAITVGVAEAKPVITSSVFGSV